MNKIPVSEYFCIFSYKKLKTQPQSRGIKSNVKFKLIAIDMKYVKVGVMIVVVNLLKNTSFNFVN